MTTDPVETNEGGEQQEQQQEQQQQETSWLDSISNADLQNNPTMQKYDSQEAQMKGHLELQAAFGKDKVVWPTGPEDEAAWAVVNEKLGVPKTPEGYDLEAVANPEGVQLFDKVKFQEMALESGASKSVAEKFWKSYTDGTKAGYEEAKGKFDANVEAAGNALKQEWGEAYETKVQRGEAVIDSFAKSQEQKDYLTATLSQDAQGLKFLADLGDQFSESRIAGFQEKQGFTKTPDEARQELARIKASPEYNSNDERIRMKAVEAANAMMLQANPGFKG